MRAARNRHGLAAAGSILTLIGALAAVTPAGVAAATAKRCANKTVVITEAGVEGAAPTHFPVPIKAITAQGTSCAAAYRFLTAEFGKSNTVTPERFKCAVAKFKAPPGLVPESCSKPGVKIQFAIQGG